MLKKETHMQRKNLTIAAIVVVVLIAIVAVTVVSAAGQGDLGKLRAATVQYKDVAAAQAAGYTLVEGLDYCFNNPGVGGMGLHYINTASLDTTVETLKPEAMVYHAGADGSLKLGAVEYIVPAGPWDAEGHTSPPSELGQTFHLNEALGVYVLHVWLWRNNPAGIYEDWNPQVTCAGIGGPS
jgi:hypothetical protein